jgi:pyruvate/2-oxoglutarate dehydrogenase complex dihydrolipoamide dehydrogenase (E3) component
VVIGGGTAGLVIAAGAAALGARVALIERERLGGDCLWTGCVPSKALIAFARRSRSGPPGSPWPGAIGWLESARERIARHDDPARFREMGVDVVSGPARLVGPGRVDVNGRRFDASRLVVATGAAPALPAIEGLAAVGYVTHRTAFDQKALPASFTMIGGGPIAVELALTYARLGAKVTVLEHRQEILPREDPEVGRLIRECLVHEGICVRTGVRVRRVAREGEAKVAYGEAGERFASSELFVAVGRGPEVTDLALERAGVELDHGAVRVDERLRTTQRGIWAAGDVTGGPQFTHAAEDMARVVVQNALTPVPTRVDYRLVPRVTFTDPEVAAVGLTAGEATAAGVRCEVSRYQFGDLDRAIVDGAGMGFCKVVTGRGGKILGATIVGRGAGELIATVVLAMRHGIPLPRLASAIYPYPTMGEIVKRTAQQWYRARYGDTWRGRLLRRLIRLWL